MPRERDETGKFANIGLSSKKDEEIDTNNHIEIFIPRLTTILTYAMIFLIFLPWFQIIIRSQIFSKIWTMFDGLLFPITPHESIDATSGNGGASNGQSWGK